MQNKNNWWYVVAGVVIIAVLVVYYTMIYTPSVSWVESYKKEDRTAYSTSIIYSLVSQLSKDNKVIESNMPAAQFLALQSGKAPANYIFINHSMSLSQTDADSLMSFAQRGNHVFISCHILPTNLSRRIFAGFVDNAEEGNPDEEMDVDSTVMIVDSSTMEEEDGNEEDGNEEEGKEEETLLPLNDSIDGKDKDAIAALTSDSIAEQLFDQDTLADSVASEEVSTSADSLKPEAKEYLFIAKIITDSVIHFRFRNSTLDLPYRQFRFQYLQDFKQRKREWAYINDSCSVNDSVRKILLGYVAPSFPVFYKYEVGKGSIFYHTLPLTLTDIYLSRPGGFEYANQIFAHLETGPVYWDNFHKDFGNSGRDGETSSTPLRYIFSQPALTWAWYVGLAGVLMYLIFYAKRRQRTIPLHKPLINSTIEFVQTLALFFKKDGDKQIVEIREKYLKLYIWQRYKIASTLPLEAYTQKVALHSGVARKNIVHIFSLANYIKKSPTKVSAELMELHKHITHFYKNSK